MSNVSVVLTTRNEPYLRRTVDDILAGHAEDPPEVIVVLDGRQKAPDLPPGTVKLDPWRGGAARGCMAARHAGIEAASGDTVFVCDAHMSFEPGTLYAVEDALARDPATVTCCRMVHLEPKAWVRGDDMHQGASMVWLDQVPGGFLPLQPKWRYGDGWPEECPCLLGASYGMRRDRYLQVLRAPWRWGTAWGTDEAVLSVTNWLCGGRNAVIPHVAGHWTRTQADVPYIPNAADVAGRWANELRLIDMLPMPDAWRAELLEACEKNDCVLQLWRHIRRMRDAVAGEVAKHREYLAGQARSFEDWRDAWCADSADDLPGKPEADMTTRTRTTKPTPRGRVKGAVKAAAPPDPPRHAIQNPVVPNPGIRCPHCHRRGTHHRVTNTYPNGRRRHICESCGKPFVSFEVER